MPVELIGDSARGDAFALARLVVDGERIVEADAPGMARRGDGERAFDCALAAAEHRELCRQLCELGHRGRDKVGALLLREAADVSDQRLVAFIEVQAPAKRRLPDAAPLAGAADHRCPSPYFFSRADFRASCFMPRLRCRHSTRLPLASLQSCFASRAT
jgi:hypothetical protein